VLLASAVPFALASIVELCARFLLPGLRQHYVFVHFLVGCFQQVGYFGAYILGDEIFLKVWRPLYFGIYLYTITVLIFRGDECFWNFRVFYVVHHGISFCITGCWQLLDDQTWCDALIRGLVLWLTAEIYVYVLNVGRSLQVHYSSTNSRDEDAGNRKESRKESRTLAWLQLICFLLERCQRFTAYFSLLVAKDWDVSDSTLTQVVLGTGMANDAVDIWFQWTSIQATFRWEQATEDLEQPAAICWSGGLGGLVSGEMSKAIAVTVSPASSPSRPMPAIGPRWAMNHVGTLSGSQC